MKRDKSAAVGLVICFVAMIAIVGAITFTNYEKKKEEKLAQTEEEKDKNEEEEPTKVTQGDKIQAELVEPDLPISETPIIEEKLRFSENDMLSWPIEGNVLMNYSMDQTIYFATLDQYKYNPALVIQGQEGQEVWAAAEGKITSIVTDAQTGTTVTMELGNGYEAVYGQLKDLDVKEGDRVSKGDLIGYLAKPTKYYSVEGCNLYFELRKDGAAINPLEYLDV